MHAWVYKSKVASIYKYRSVCMHVYFTYIYMHASIYASLHMPHHPCRHINTHSYVRTHIRFPSCRPACLHLDLNSARGRLAADHGRCGEAADRHAHTAPRPPAHTPCTYTRVCVGSDVHTDVHADVDADVNARAYPRRGRGGGGRGAGGWSVGTGCLPVAGLACLLLFRARGGDRRRGGVQ